MNESINQLIKSHMLGMRINEAQKRRVYYIIYYYIIYIYKTQYCKILLKIQNV